MISTWPSYSVLVPVLGGTAIVNTHVFVGALGDVRSELIVINPDASAVSDGDAVIVEDVADLEVLKNDTAFD